MDLVLYSEFNGYIDMSTFEQRNLIIGQEAEFPAPSRLRRARAFLAIAILVSGSAAGYLALFATLASITSSGTSGLL